MKTPGVVLRLFLVAITGLGLSAQQEPTAPQSGLQRTRAYDVRDIAHREPWFLPAPIVDAAFVPTVHDTSEELRPALDLADVAQLIKTGTGMTYWEREGVELRVEDTGFLSLTCDEDMHTRVRAVLTRLRRLLFEPVLVEVHELPGSALQGRGSVLSAEETDALLAQAGSHRIYAGRTSPQRPLLLEAKRIQNRIAGMHMRVAQSAAAPDLEIAAENNGASWTVHAARAIGDALLVRVSGSERSQEAGPVCEVPSGDGHVASLALPVIRIASCEASAYLRPGQAMLVGADAPGAALLCVRVQRTAPPTALELGETAVYPIGNLVRGAPRPVALPLPYDEGTLFPVDEDEPMPAVFDDGRLQEWLRSQVAPESWDGAPNSMSSLDGMLFVNADEDVRSALVEQLQALQALDARQFTLEVRFGDVPEAVLQSVRGANAEQLAEALPSHCIATLSASRAARLSATWHTPYVRDYDAVLASGSAVTTPRFGSIARGFLLQGRVAPMDQGTVLLDVQMSLLAHPATPAVFALQDPRFNQVGKVDVAENKVRGSTAVTLGEWTILQLAPVEGGKGHVAIVARLRGA